MKTISKIGDKIVTSEDIQKHLKNFHPLQEVLQDIISDKNINNKVIST